MGERIKELRTKRGLTQQHMADSLGMNRANFSNYERGIAVPPSDTLTRIAELLNVSTDYLLGASIEPTPYGHVPAWATSKDKRDFKKMLDDEGELMFDGIPLNADDKQRIKDVLTGLFWEAKRMNKRKPPATDAR